MKLEGMSPKGTDRALLRFEGGETAVVSLGLAAKLGLYTGMELDADAMRELRSGQRQEETMARAASLMALRPLSEKELRTKLKERGSSEKNIDAAVSRLKRMGALNDADYARYIVRGSAAKGFGKNRIKDEFFKRGIPRELWEEALEDYEPPEDKIDALISRRLDGKLPDRKEIGKTADALYRRGFSWDEIKSALSRYEQQLSEDEDVL